MFFTLDLKSGYHHVSHLGLSWMVKGEQEFFLLIWISHYMCYVLTNLLKQLESWF
jgi:hypothetical protein